MTILKRIANGFRSRIVKGAAIAAAAAVGFSAMGETAMARGQQSGQPHGAAAIELAHGGHGYARNTRCITHAIRRNGRILRGTRGVGVRKARRRACRVALRACRYKLNRKRHRTGRAYPRARCEVTRVRRASGHRHSGGSIILRF